MRGVEYVCLRCCLLVVVCLCVMLGMYRVMLYGVVSVVAFRLQIIV